MTFRIPAEREPHVCCWMAWAVGAEWKSWINEVKKELERVISTIAQFELVRLLTPPDQLADARARFSGGNVEIIEAPVCTENRIRVDAVRESPRLTRW